MPEHFHAVIGPTPEANPSQIMQRLEDRTALFILFWNDASVLAMDAVP
jgi:REP element-mobilizing transposase RayT